MFGPPRAFCRSSAAWIFHCFTWTFSSFTVFRVKFSPIFAGFRQKSTKNISFYISFYRLFLRFLQFSQKSFSKSVDFPATRGYNTSCSALVAQLDRVSDYESEGRGFESLPAHQGHLRKQVTFFCFIRAEKQAHSTRITASFNIESTSVFLNPYRCLFRLVDDSMVTVSLAVRKISAN